MIRYKNLTMAVSYVGTLPFMGSREHAYLISIHNLCNNKRAYLDYWCSHIFETGEEHWKVIITGAFLDAYLGGIRDKVYNKYHIENDPRYANKDFRRMCKTNYKSLRRVFKGNVWKLLHEFGRDM